MNVLIRKAKEEDLPSILALLSEVDEPNQDSISLQKARTIFSQILSYPNYHIYIAMIEEEVVGTFALLIMENLVHDGAPSGIVEDVAVKTAWQGRGIGKHMMKYAMQMCKEAGCYKLSLSSNVQRENAHKFYESLGFVKYGYSFEVDVT